MHYPHLGTENTQQQQISAIVEVTIQWGDRTIGKTIGRGAMSTTAHRAGIEEGREGIRWSAFQKGQMAWENTQLFQEMRCGEEL